MTRIPLKRRILYGYFWMKYRWDRILYALGLWPPDGPAPHLIKRRVVREYAHRFGARVLVETGTYMGDMLAAVGDEFEELHSIELSPAFYEKACARFATRRKIHLYRGDSGETLPKVIDQLNGLAIFWLDAHYSGGTTARGTIDTPIADELRHILGRTDADHVILIDDARCFSGNDGYPTIEQVRQMVRELRSDYVVAVAEDIIRLTPRMSS